jgi:lipoprotein-anchoring transpeptidase ErfK/SrfK
MVLASQSSRQSPRNRFTSNAPSRRGRGRLLLIGVGLIVVAAVGFLGWKWMTSEDAQTPAPVERATQVPASTPAPPVPAGGEVTIELKSDQVIGGSDAPKAAAPATITATPTTPAIAAPVEAPKATASQGSQPQGVIGAPAAPGTAPQVASPSQPGTMALDETIAMADRDPVRARVQLTRLLEGSALSTADRMRGYDAINRINGVLVFSNRVVNGDPYSANYKVEAGDSLARIAKSQKLDCDWRLVQRINGISNPNGLKVGQSVKLPKGSFHGEVRKSEYRLNMYLGEGPDRVMIASYPIGLGELNTTPTGAFIVRPKSKLIDPEWRNPRTGEFFQSNDPKNPIGERWIGLKGIEPHNKGFEGYGIHGTIDLESIGQQRSMGCVRMRSNDVELVYEMLTEPNSTITIAP